MKPYCTANIIRESGSCQNAMLQNYDSAPSCEPSIGELMGFLQAKLLFLGIGSGWQMTDSPPLSLAGGYRKPPF